MGRVPPERSLAVALRAGLLEAPADLRDMTTRAQETLEDVRLLLSWFPDERERTGKASQLARRSVSGNKYGAQAGKMTAARLRDLLDLGDSPIQDVTTVVEDLGVPVLLEEMPKSVQGVTMRDDFDPQHPAVVIVNCTDWWGRQRFTLAHELCHVLNEDSEALIVERKQVDPKDFTEYRCEVFARHFLAPAPAVRAFGRRYPSAKHGVSDQLALFMMEFGISKQVAIKIFEEDLHVPAASLAPYRHTPIAGMMARAGLDAEWQTACSVQAQRAPSNWLLGLALDAYSSGLVRGAVVARIMGREDTDAVEFELEAGGWSSNQ
jgi:Zn-dependent peptidase ImmA (M78 family)